MGDGAESRCCDDTPEQGGTADGKEEKPFGDGAESRLDSAIRADLAITRCQTDVCFCPFFVHAPEFFPRDLLVNVSKQNIVIVIVIVSALDIVKREGQRDTERQRNRETEREIVDKRKREKESAREMRRIKEEGERAGVTKMRGREERHDRRKRDTHEKRWEERQ